MRFRIESASVVFLCAASCAAPPPPSAPVARDPVQPAPSAPDPFAVLSDITFGSCSDMTRPAPVFRTIADEGSDLCIFAGDNVYADTEDMDEMWDTYQELAADPDFRALRASTPLVATWDDHDYGVNDGGAEYPMRRESRELFMRFWGIGPDSPMAAREGVYDARVWGPPGRRVQVILLDTRYFRSALTRRDPGVDYGSGGRYRPSTDTNATMLGAAQWSWLREQLEVPAELRLLVSSVQVVPDDHGWEKWGNHPQERDRLFSLIRETGARGVVVLSGDRHLAEISILPADDPKGVGYPLIDVTASGLNKGGGGSPDEPNRYRMGDNFRGNNYGRVSVDWDASDPLVTLEVLDEEGRSVRRHDVRLGALRAGG